ncbi:hypothetical protein SCUCBS95973_006946 [Sporothrix curviconia]|uniref:Major facilitator superfamily (MFS) profile domain-containing protein n=1 Tax=Sporothrix curviconia TaxID=1260050 RepID=A0ABP0C9E0_9PEZI
MLLTLAEEMRGRGVEVDSRREDAFAAFKKSRAEEIADESQDEAIRNEFLELCAHLHAEQRHAVTTRQMFTQSSMRKRCTLGFLVMVGAQATGTIVINNYGTSLYKSLGFSSLNQLVMAAAWVTVAPIGNLFNALVVDRFGRVRMLVTGYIGCLVALIGASVTIALYDKTGGINRHLASAAVFFLFLHVGVFTFTIDATTYVYASEIFPTGARARGLFISVSGLFLSSMTFVVAAGKAFQNIGWKYYMLFASLTTVFIIITIMFFPETRQRSLEDMGALFGDAVIDAIEPVDLEPPTAAASLTDDANDANAKPEKEAMGTAAVA